MIMDDKKQQGIYTWRLGYEKSKQKAKNIYTKIGRIPCPALDDEIVAFNSIGLKHLMRKGKDTRPRKDNKLGKTKKTHS